MRGSDRLQETSRRIHKQDKGGVGNGRKIQSYADVKREIEERS